MHPACKSGASAELVHFPLFSTTTTSTTRLVPPTTLYTAGLASPCTEVNTDYLVMIAAPSASEGAQTSSGRISESAVLEPKCENRSQRSWFRKVGPFRASTP